MPILVVKYQSYILKNKTLWTSKIALPRKKITSKNKQEYRSIYVTEHNNIIV